MKEHEMEGSRDKKYDKVAEIGRKESGRMK
jgi:hypothetical protein